MSAYYCYFEGVKGVDAIYLVSADNLPWATIKAEDVITSLMTSNYLVDLKNVEVVYNGKRPFMRWKAQAQVLILILTAKLPHR